MADTNERKNANEKIKIALILDKNKIDLWQYIALKKISDLADICLILNCTNTTIKRNIKIHFLYYFLNLFSIRNRFSKKLTCKFNEIRKIDFVSIYEHNWQSLPDEVVQELKKSDISLVIKFGMGLLKRNDPKLNIPIFSFHHGDPDKYRGRPAGFYEMLFDESSCGVIVQDICDVLDGGVVYAKGYSKIFKHSYKKTVENFYQISGFVLREAINNFISNINLKTEALKKPKGKNFRLPSNSLVLKFSFKLLKFKIKRLLYGLFYEKAWKVSIIESYIDPMKNNVLQTSLGHTLQVNSKFKFYADPFFGFSKDEIYLEALRSSTGLGSIIAVDGRSSTVRDEIFSGNHYSYPNSIKADGVFLLFPEVAGHSSPFFINMRRSDSKKEKIYLKGLEQKKLIDATLFPNDGLLYLFAGEPDLANNVLHLYFSKSLSEKFQEHPCSPIRIDPEGARMGGNIISYNDELFRIGQDNRFGYGEKVNVFKIQILDENSYSEKLVSSVRVDGKFGPHTINVQGDKVVFDFYENHFSVLAWYRRLLGLFLRHMSGIFFKIAKNYS